MSICRTSELAEIKPKHNKGLAGTLAVSALQDPPLSEVSGLAEPKMVASGPQWLPSSVKRI